MRPTNSRSVRWQTRSNRWTVPFSNRYRQLISTWRNSRKRLVSRHCRRVMQPRRNPWRVGWQRCSRMLKTVLGNCQNVPRRINSCVCWPLQLCQWPRLYWLVSLRLRLEPYWRLSYFDFPLMRLHVQVGWCCETLSHCCFLPFILFFFLACLVLRNFFVNLTQHCKFSRLRCDNFLLNFTLKWDTVVKHCPIVVFVSFFLYPFFRSY